jgi:mannose-1-phosphate guanylyltransferase
MALATQAVILAGGQGTRLRPLTLSRAKPVVPLLNRPFLAYQIAWLREHGVTDVVLSCSYRVEDVRQALGDARDLGVALRYVVEDTPLGTGGGVRNAADLARGTVFVLNGDVLTDADLGAMRAGHEARGARVSILLTPVDDPRAYGLVEAAPDGRVLRFREKPGADEPITTNLINAGVYLIDAALLARMPAGRAVSIEREFFPEVIADGLPCYGWSADAYWRDIGHPAAYRAAQVDLLEGRVRTTLAPAGELRHGCWVDGPAPTPSARLEGPSVVGGDVRLGPSTHIGPHAVIGPGCVIGAGARVQEAVLWERVRVGEGAVVRQCVVGADAVIAARATVGPGVALGSGAVVPATPAGQPTARG